MGDRPAADADFEAMMCRPLSQMLIFPDRRGCTDETELDWS